MWSTSSIRAKANSLSGRPSPWILGFLREATGMSQMRKGGCRLDISELTWEQLYSVLSTRQSAGKQKYIASSYQEMHHIGLVITLPLPVYASFYLASSLTEADIFLGISFYSRSTMSFPEWCRWPYRSIDCYHHIQSNTYARGQPLLKCMPEVKLCSSGIS